ncbi:MAG TPA: DUF3570 domain-containing protein [Flavisolibacter sp.]|jgi:hypothetical protein|nr:DUF3570 domain-containing protein [Flavisolibacter sp.]
MRKLSLTVIGMYIGILSAFSQNTSADTSYKQRKLKLDEVNFVSGYYHQDGNNSAVTGGIGTENLTDFANTIELKFSKYDLKNRKHSLGFEMGIDHYTSASSDKIDPYTISSASMSDTRFYPSASWSIQNEVKGTTVGLNASFSKEFDYRSFGLGGTFTKTSKDNNQEFTAKIQAYLDQWSVIYPIELRSATGIDFGHSGISGYSPRNSFSGSFSFSQVINQRFQLLFITEPTYQSGLLATKYQRVYFTDGSERAETLPDQRFKIPVGVRANYFFGSRYILKTYYRFYKDSWGILAHTIDLEAPLKITPFFSISPFYRYYTQNKADYFAPYSAHLVTENYFTSDYDLSAFNSQFFGTGFRFVPAKGVFGVQSWNSLELRYGHYLRSNGLHADQVSLALSFK